MADSRPGFEEARAARSALRARVEREVQQVRADLAARGIGARIGDQAKTEARALGTKSLAVARESKGIIAATVAALGLWLLRKPVLRTIAARRQRPADIAAESGE